ncbi:MAG: cytochrome b/b6 domain-containing protein [Proteobacteria bacterium]|nr:cytochrome b/b6 domain-containing protein [Pseudomonadota bacterium]RTL38725.1 MAG: cytochrome B [Rhodocyclaceae bacterium]
MNRQRIWDLPIRLFHWSLVASVAFAYVSGKIGGNLIEWHGRAGYLIVGLVIFRIVWGFVGSATARFASFVRGPGAIRAYLRGEWRGIGHNPIGALSVLGLLALVGAQAATGLFTNDDIAFQGPLADLVGKDASDSFHSWHAWLQNGLLALIVLHVGAIAFYLRVKGENLVKPMITGWQEVDAHTPVPSAHAKRGGGLVAFILSLLIAGGATYAVAGGLLPTPEPAPAQPAATSTTPAW